MPPKFSKRQMQAGLEESHNFARWYVEEIMRYQQENFVSDLGIEACEEQTRNGRLYALHFGFTDPEDQALFLTLMWDVGPNFFEEREYAAVLADQNLTASERAFQLFEVSPNATENALKRADHMYWFPWYISENILGLEDDPEWLDDAELDQSATDGR